MKRILLLLPLLIASQPLSASRGSAKSTVLHGAKTAKAKTARYTVKSGDTLYTIAHAHRTTIKEVREANGLEPGALIRVGQKLTVPVDTYFPETVNRAKGVAKNNPSIHRKPTTRRIAQKPKASSSKTARYTVKSGDTLYTIAHAHHTTIKEVREANGLEPGALIRVGQKLTVPVDTYFPERSGPSSHGSAVALRNTSKNKTGKRQRSGSRADRGVSGTQGAKIDIYTVVAGDTLFSIARKHQVSLRDLMAKNKLEPGAVIKVGQQLKIPASGYRVALKHAERKKKAQAKPTRSPTTYTVRKGDSLWSIAHAHGLSISQLRAMNKLGRRSVIHRGMVLTVRVNSAEQTPKRAQTKTPRRTRIVYTVKRGDTLWHIATSHGLSVQQVRALNSMGPREVIRRGMKLTLLVDKQKSATSAGSAGMKKKTHQSVAKKTKKKHPGSRRLAKGAKRRSSERSRADRRLQNAIAILNGSGSSARGSNRVIRIAKRYLGRRYVWGAEGPNSFDCSGFAQYVMKKAKGVTLPRVSRRQAYYGKYVSRRNLKPGDLIFFDTSHSRRGYVNHVGIYIGNNKFIHASSARHRVVITSLNRPFYRARFKWGRRVN